MLVEMLLLSSLSFLALDDKEVTDTMVDSDGWLRTGDLCYFDNEGFLFIVDRLKELIKYKGYQVHPAKLEHILHTHPDITEAAVIRYAFLPSKIVFVT
uniref:AMP-dependent synthetase/ligase domain-containing protein n=1 Tax=Lactuca sativa TaxID=4236 RepID=A0A9R1V470_LACSA|nr:hypothetical protein LSAT_V11C700367890 [Lactuca sativa]